MFAKAWSLHGGILLTLAALIFYITDNTFWLYAPKGGAGLARGGMLFSVASALLAAVIGALFFRETLTTVQVVGILVGLVSVGLLSW